MKHLILAAALLLPITAHAQQAAPPQEQALSLKLQSEINQGLQCSASLIALQRELAIAQARLKELEAKAKPDDVGK